MNSDQLIAAGFSIFPLRPNVKAGFYKNVSWKRTTTDDPVQAMYWHSGIAKGEDDSGNPVSFEGCSWGIACGPSNICVVDIDVKDGAPGLVSKAQMEQEYGALNPGFVVQTQSGGAHYYFTGKCRSQNNFLGSKEDKSGIDIKSDGGMVMAPGSIVNGEDGYVVINGTPADMTTAPQWIIKSLGQRAVRKAVELVAGKEMSDLQRRELESALDYIPCTDYDTIIYTVGMAIHHSYPGSDGLEVWDDWCKGLGERYDSSLCEKKWITFRQSTDSSKDRTVASLFFEAKQNRWPGVTAAEAFEIEATLPDEDEPLETLPDFPIEVFHSSWARLAQETADIAMMPVQLPAMVMLATVSGALGKSAEAVGGSNHGPCRGNLFISGVAPSSTGKDVAAKLADPIHIYAEKLKNMAAFNSSEDYEPPKLIINNATSEALIRRMSTEQGALFSFSSEAGDMVRIALGAYKKQGGDFASLNAAWSGGFISVDRIGRDSVHLADPCLSLFWAVQPDFFAELASNGEAIQSGFLPRCLCFDSEATYAHDDGNKREISPELLQQWEQLVGSILDQRLKAEDTIQYFCDESATEVFRIFHNRIQDRRINSPECAALLGKARENAIRVALILAVMEKADGISEDLAQRAVNLVEWCLNSTLIMVGRFNMDRTEGDAKKLYDKIKSRQYNGEASIRDLVRNSGYDKNSLLQLVDSFPSMFETVKIPTKGRPSERIRTK